MDKRLISVEDLNHIKFVADPRIDPSGEKVALTVKRIDPLKNSYLSHLYMAEIKTGSVRQFTQGDGYDTTPRWSPDGERIAFLRVREGCTQLWLISASGGEACQLTHLEEGSFGALNWSPDGGQIAFEFRPTHPDWTQEAYKNRAEKGSSKPARVITKFHYRRDGEGFRDLYQHIWTCDVVSGASMQITDGEWDDRDAAWSPNGKQIAFVSNRGDDPIARPYEEDIWLLAQSGGELERVATPSGYKRDLAWSPDGESIAYIGVETQDDPWVTRNDRLWVAPLQSDFAPCCLTETLDRTVENATISDGRGVGNQSPVWSPDGQRITFLVSDRGNCHLYSVDLDGGSKSLVAGAMDIAGFSVDSRGEVFALLISSPDKPAEVYVASRDEKTGDFTLNALSNLNGDWLALLQLSVPEEIWFESFDGVDIQGWLLMPPGFDLGKQYPLLLYIHGGPGAQYGNTFFHEFQVLAAHGFIVFYTNPRGSLGREEDFATSIRGNWGDLDFKDLLAAADYAESLPYVDPEKMSVAGGSYGGFMATWMVGHTDRFRCAITERGVSNRHSAVGTSDFPPMPGGYWQGNAWDSPDKLWDQSPLRHAAKIHTPLLIIHSEGDLRCPVGQAEQLFSALKQLKREVVFIRYPAETSHGFSRNGPPDLRIDRLGRIVAWLEKHIKHE